MIVKVCGVTSLDDGKQALDAGADWIGLNLVSGPRKIELAHAMRIAAGLIDPSRAVALFAADNGSEWLRALAEIRAAGVHRVQLYGQVTPQAIREPVELGFESLFVHAAASPSDIESAGAFLKSCGSRPPGFILLDSAGATQLGGTGRRADWNAIAAARLAGKMSDWPPMLLAGGLTPENVQEAIRMVLPDGVDVSSGVESSPGRKDISKVHRFIQSIRSATPPCR